MVKFYISFAGKCDEAIQFYQKVFDSPILKLVRYSDLQEITELSNDRIMHSEIVIEGTTFIFSDYMEHMTLGDNFSILLEVDNNDKVKAYYENLKDGSLITIDIGPIDLPGEHCSMYVNLKDKFGLNWIIMCRQK